MCFQYFEIFKYNEYYKKYGLDIFPNGIGLNDTVKIWEHAQDILDTLSVNDLQDYSPSISETISYCALRNGTKGKIISYFQEHECNENIAITKYVNNHRICYQIKLLKPMNGIDDSIISFDPFEPNIVNIIAFDSELFKNISFFNAFYSYNDGTMTDELIQTTLLDRVVDNGHPLYNGFGLRYYESRVKNLKSPYTTKCRDYNQREEYFKCVNDSLVLKYNRFSPMSRHVSGNLKLMTVKLLSNVSISQSYIDITQQCTAKYQDRYCDYKLITSSNDERVKWPDFNVYSLLPDTLSIVINHRPRLIFTDYIILVFSSFGTWLGISFLGLNPFKYVEGNATAAIHSTVDQVPNIQNTILFRLILDTLREHQAQININCHRINRMR